MKKPSISKGGVLGEFGAFWPLKAAVEVHGVLVLGMLFNYNHRDQDPRFALLLPLVPGGSVISDTDLLSGV